MSTDDGKPLTFSSGMTWEGILACPSGNISSSPWTREEQYRVEAMVPPPRLPSADPFEKTMEQLSLVEKKNKEAQASVQDTLDELSGWNTRGGQRYTATIYKPKQDEAPESTPTPLSKGVWIHPTPELGTWDSYERSSNEISEGLKKMVTRSNDIYNTLSAALYDLRDITGSTISIATDLLVDNKFLRQDKLRLTEEVIRLQKKLNSL